VPGGGALDLAAVVEYRHGQADGAHVGAYARVRSQFKMAIGRFEGVEEPLARIGAYTYMMDAVRKMTAGAIDLGEKPSVVSAIAKYHVTERARQVVNDGMDILGGKGICLGPSTSWAAPISRSRSDHGRGRQHPDAQPDHLRPGRDPLPSLRAQGNGAAKNPDAEAGPARLRRRPSSATSGSPSRALPVRWSMGLTGSQLRRCRPMWRRKPGATTSS
jgi:hypothetical protein